MFDGGRLPQPQLSARIAAAAASSARPPSLPPPPRPPAAPAAPREPRCEPEVPLPQRDPRPQPPPVIFGSSQHGARRAERGDAAGETRTLRRRLRHPRSRRVTRRRPARHHGACRQPGPAAAGAGPSALRGAPARAGPSGQRLGGASRPRRVPAASAGAAPRGLRGTGDAASPAAAETPRAKSALSPHGRCSSLRGVLALLSQPLTPIAGAVPGVWARAVLLDGFQPKKKKNKSNYHRMLMV